MKILSTTLKDQRGAALVISLVFMVLLTILGIAGIMISSTDLKVAKNEISSSKSLYIAEAGLERGEIGALEDLQYDANIANSTFNSTTLGTTFISSPTAGTFYSLGSFAFGGGSYTVEVMFYNTNGGGLEPAEAKVRSTGVGPDGSTSVLESFFYAEDVSIWNNAIFGGGGGSGSIPINGNVKIAGSIHILGNGVTPTTTVFYNQTGDCKNNHTGMDTDLANCFFYGTSSDLKSKFRIRNGKVDMTVGSGFIGQSTSYYKGIYVGAGVDGGGGVNADILGGNNGVGGTGSQNLYAEEGASSPKPYDLGVSVTMPSIDTTLYNSNCLDLTTAADQTSALVSGSLTLDDGASYQVSATSGDGSISYDGSASPHILSISGLVKVRTLTMNKNADLQVSGKGILYVSDPTGVTVYINNDIYSTGATWPTTDLLVIVSHGDMQIGSSSQLEITGAFFSEGDVYVNMQTEIAGTIVCSTFNIGSQVPKIWQTPSLAANLPALVPGNGSNWVITEKTWRQDTM
ncbi:MAG: pilus assembly PilX N-terminal domain-containing protein [Thermodesulfobacteriota bacterium]|nr:pilus assembly PilX N-terminal domain-containing protein [Thermodesulfobacteriota bacterium]